MKHVVFILGLLVSTCIFGQELWLSTAFKGNITEYWKLKYEQNLRTTDGLKATDVWFNEVELGYELTPFLDLSGTYRYSSNYLGDNEQRLSFDLSGSIPFGDSDWELNIRSRYQRDNRVTDGRLSESWRNRIEVAYDFDRSLSPFASLESFHEEPQLLKRSKYRYTLGVESEVKKRLGLALFIRYQRDTEIDLDVGEVNEWRRIIGINLSFKLGLNPTRLRKL